MAKATSAEGLDKKLYSWVSEVGERFGADRVNELLGATLVSAVKTKATVDKNIDNLLAMANIPSRADYHKMQRRLDSLQGSVMSLTRKIDALANSVGGGKGARKHSAGAKPATKRSATTRCTSSRERGSTTAMGRPECSVSPSHS